MILEISLTIVPFPLLIQCTKFCASLIQKGLSAYFDDKIRPTQFGLRASRSTSQPIHIVRRMLEAFERQPQPLHLLFLDWSKAFESVTFDAMEAALQYFGIPPLFQKARMALYSHPQFRVRDAGQTSTTHPQTRGLRQGCPLSPYLFNLVLSHLFCDVEIAYNQHFGPLAGVLNTPFPLWDLEYDDDTTLLSSSARQLTRLLHLLQLLQHHGSIRGLHLNFSKRAHLKLHSSEKTTFSAECVSPCNCTKCHGPLPPTFFRTGN